MKFGPVPTSKALDAILAHSVKLPSGERLRKGILLEVSHIEALASADVTEVTVARLEEGDVHENDAALTIAQALSDSASHVQLSAPFTGRVNLIAERPGVAHIDVDKINAANAVNPMITIATVPEFHQLEPGGMAATVKIISYGAPRSAVEEAARLAQGGVAVMPPVYRTASVIVTRIAGEAKSADAKAVLTRLERLGIGLEGEPIRCAHDETALAKAIADATGEMILILTGSATSDPQDTAPAALRRAGGRVERFGMPVDPGNLLFLGDLGGKPVIGLPGSARSPVLHGADWVLSRVACGVPVGSADIAGMGVGGLLKEIPTRPMPRRGLNTR